MKLNFKTIIALVIALLALAFPSLRSLLLDSEEECEIVKQMQTGAKMYVLGYSKANSKAYDTYSLFGFTDAYKKMLELCK